MPEANVVSLEDGLSATVVSKNRVGAMTHLFPRGNLVGDEAQVALRKAIEESIEAREIMLIVDMVSVSTLNSKTLELLVDLHQGLLKKGGWIKLTNAKPLVRDIFRVTGVDQIIDIVNSFNIDNTEIDSKLTPPTEPVRMGELLVSRGLLTPEKVEEAILLQQKTGKK